MKFAHPEILWALGALAIPIIVHLFNFRRFKRIAFSNVAFLREVQIETKSRNRLRHLLILTSRLLALAALILAFAQPYIPLEEGASKSNVRSVSLYIDNSFSMEALSEDGPLIDLSKARAYEVVSAYQATDRFNIITNDLEGRHQRFYSQEEALELINEIDASPAARPIAEMVERQQDLLRAEGEGDLSAFVFSDLQQSTHNAEQFVPDSAIAYRFVPETAARSENLFIDSVWFETPVRLPGQPEVLRIRIRNTALNGLDNVPMRLDVNNQQVAIGSFNVIPGTYTDTALYFTSENPGIKHARVSIQDHPIVYDDDWFFSYQVAAQVNVMLIKGNSNGRAFRTVFGNDPFYRFEETDERNVNYGAIRENDLVILDRLGTIPSGLTSELSNLMQSGGSVLFIPSADGDRNSWNELLLAAGAPAIAQKQELQTKVAELNLNHLIYRGVFDKIPENIDLPSVKTYYRFDRTARSGEVALMSLQNGDPFFFTASNGPGRIFVAASPLDPEAGNFAQHALFVPTVLRAAELSRPTGRMDDVIGEANTFFINGLQMPPEATFSFSRVGSDEAFIPRHRPARGGIEVFYGDQRTTAGNYELILADSAVATIGLNYSRAESVLNAYTNETWSAALEAAGWPRFAVVESNLDTIAKTIEELDEGKRLWLTFLIIALAFLLIEVLLIKIRTT